MTKHVTQCSETCRGGIKRGGSFTGSRFATLKEDDIVEIPADAKLEGIVIKTKREIKAIQGNQVYCQSLLLVSK